MGVLARPLHDGRRLVTNLTLLGASAVPIAAGGTARRAAIVVAVADAATGAPIENAYVAVPALGRSARTDWLGEAALGGIPVGMHRVQVRHVGHSPADVDVRVGSRSDTVRPAFMLEPRVATLQPVAVHASPLRRGPPEYEGRRRTAIGRFITDSALASDREPSLALNIAKRVAGLMVRIDESGRFTLRSARMASSQGRVQACGIDLYVDGFRSAEPVDALFTSEVAGVEASPMSAAPPQYRRKTGGCHVILIWTWF